MTYQLKTRPPTGQVPWPLVLLEGAEKSGKSWACAVLSASPRVGRTYWVDLGEGAGDEYGAIPGVRYEVVEHDGTWADICGAVLAIRDEAARASAAGGPPTVLVIDTITAEWELLKSWTVNRARERLARKGRHIAPDTEPNISMDLWNDANASHGKLMAALMTFPGIAVITARGKDVAVLDDAGKPVEGARGYKVDGQKNLAFEASVWVRMSRDHPPLVVGARSVHAGVRPGVDRPKAVDEFSLEWLVFEYMGCNPGSAHTRNLVEGKPERTATQIRDDAVDPDVLRTTDELRDDYAEARRSRLLDATVPNESGAHEALGALLIRLGKARAAARTPATDPRRRHMFALFGQAEIVEREHRLAYVGEVVGHPVATTNDLASDEVDAVVKRLESWLAQQSPPAEAVTAA